MALLEMCPIVSLMIFPFLVTGDKKVCKKSKILVLPLLLFHHSFLTIFTPTAPFHLQPDGFMVIKDKNMAGSGKKQVFEDSIG